MSDEENLQNPDAATEPLPTEPFLNGSAPTDPFPTQASATEALVTEPLMTAPPATETTAQASDAQGPSFLRRHSFASALIGTALAVVLVSGGTAWAVAASVPGNEATATAVSSAAPTAGSSTAAEGAAGSKAGANAKTKGARILARGTIITITPSNWSIKTPAGATVSVSITSTTKYGRPKAPATASTFAAGDPIIVIGHRTGDTMTARRIVAPGAHGKTTGSSSTTSDLTTS